MKQLFLVGISLLVVATCASPPDAAAQTASTTNTTNYYDGQYSGNFVLITHPSGDTSQCPNVKVAPALTVRNGTAKFNISDIVFQGIVTPEGELLMHADTGQTFVGQFDPYGGLKGRVTGKCFYDASWEKYTKRP